MRGRSRIGNGRWRARERRSHVGVDLRTADTQRMGSMGNLEILGHLRQPEPDRRFGSADPAPGRFQPQSPRRLQAFARAHGKMKSSTQSPAWATSLLNRMRCPASHWFVSTGRMFGIVGTLDMEHYSESTSTYVAFFSLQSTPRSASDAIIRESSE